MPFSDALASGFIEQRLDLMRFDSRLRRQVLLHLRELEDDLESKIRRFDIEGVQRDAFKRRRAEALIRDVRDTIQSAYTGAAGSLRRGLVDLATFVQEDSVGIFNTAFRADVFNPTLSGADLRKLSNQNILGGPARDYWRRQAQGTQDAFARQIRVGVLSGETNTQLVERVRGVRTGRTLSFVTDEGRIIRSPEFARGAIQTSERHARTLVRTSVQNTSNQVVHEMYRANQDVLRGEEALVTLDGRTTAICMSRSGGAWDFEGNPLPESSTQEGFPGPPPWHFQCRTILVPITKSWDDMLEDTGSKRKGVLNTVPNSVQASIDGQVPGNLSFEQWLGTKSPSFARRKLGPARYELWKEGKISLVQLIDQSGRPATLDQLRAIRSPAKTPVPVG